MARTTEARARCETRCPQGCNVCPSAQKECQVKACYKQCFEEQKERTTAAKDKCALSSRSDRRLRSLDQKHEALIADRSQCAEAEVFAVHRSGDGPMFLTVDENTPDQLVLIGSMDAEGDTFEQTWTVRLHKQS